MRFHEFKADREASVIGDPSFSVVKGTKIDVDVQKDFRDGAPSIELSQVVNHWAQPANSHCDT